MSQVDVAAKNVQFFFIQFDEEILAVRIMKCNNQYNDATLL